MTVTSRKTTDLLESFTLWANSNGVERFWGVAKTGDGRLSILLPTLSDDYAAVIIQAPEPDTNLVFIAIGSRLPGAISTDYQIGQVGDAPGMLLRAAVKWLIASARDYGLVEMNEMAREAAHVAARISYFLNDTALELAAVDVKNSIPD